MIYSTYVEKLIVYALHDHKSACKKKDREQFQVGDSSLKLTIFFVVGSIITFSIPRGPTINLPNNWPANTFHLILLLLDLLRICIFVWIEPRGSITKSRFHCIHIF